MGEGPSDANDKYGVVCKRSQLSIPHQKRRTKYSGQVKRKVKRKPTQDRRFKIQVKLERQLLRTPRAWEVHQRAKKYSPVSSSSKRRSSPQEKTARMNQKIHPKQSPLATPQTPATPQQLDSLNLKAGASDCKKRGGTVEAGKGAGRPI